MISRKRMQSYSKMIDSIEEKTNFVLHYPFSRLLVDRLHTGKWHWSLETIGGIHLAMCTDQFDSFLECVQDFQEGQESC